MSFWNEKEAKILFNELFKELFNEKFYNVLLKKPYIKRLNNMDMLGELPRWISVPLYDELSIAKTTKVFKGYARAYSTEIIDSKYLRG